ncbi:hypothetical protein [Spirilliplanes yamanashiensis]|uniref:Uncharacterized protein n=1 Tax=Spirilliplanes yamanashiensis TaxID=42233 RepID=A0A8J3YA86_9ACTN|nr:hypothetical protein [Spirilliplanes yamanashiensis]MDP9817574.1 hypothetical protein [Spirilliplanes yamanashiensis]GIJ04384.1 hypothetical protein Sya03_37360 [Spirilliplanes yamanashiensis]
MSYDVSEQAADDTSGWSAPTGPRHRYDPARPVGGTGGYPVPPPSIAAQLRPSPGWSGATGQTPAAAATPSWTSPGAATSEWLSPTRTPAPAPAAPVPAATPAAAVPAGRPAGSGTPEWVQTPSGEWVRAKAAGDWAATASGEWQPVTRRLPSTPPPAPAPQGTSFGATPPGYEQAGYDRPGYGAGPDQPARDRSGYEPSAREQSGYEQPGYEQSGYDQPGYQQPGYRPPLPRQEQSGFWGAAPEPAAPPAPPADPAPAPSPYADPVYRTHDPAAADLRSQVVRRIRFMNFRHAEHAWERRYRDPIGPHALAFLYAEPARGKPPRNALKTATRLFLAGPEVDDLPQLLADLTQVVTAAPHGRLDCRTLTDRAEDMTPGATYMGVAVSSLDTPAGRWADVRQQVAGSIDVPGRCYALLADGTMILMDRGGQSRFGHFEVRSTDSLDEIPGDSMQRWTYDRSLADLADPATYDIWVRLRGLHDAVVAGGHR